MAGGRLDCVVGLGLSALHWWLSATSAAGAGRLPAPAALHCNRLAGVDQGLSMLLGVDRPALLLRAVSKQEQHAEMIP